MKIINKNNVTIILRLTLKTLSNVITPRSSYHIKIKKSSEKNTNNHLRIVNVEKKLMYETKKESNYDNNVSIGLTENEIEK